MKNQANQARLLNLTAHTLSITVENAEEPLLIPSDGELTLRSCSFTCADANPLVYRKSDAMFNIPLMPASIFMDYDEESPGYKHLTTLTQLDAVIVSLPVARWMANNCCRFKVYSPGRGRLNMQTMVHAITSLQYHSKLSHNISHSI